MGNGKYRLGERIGGGGMAEVFRGTLMGVEGFARPVAIKRMLPTLSADDAFAEMFVNEARLASLLAHPNIVNVVDFDRDPEGRLFIVMELVEGKDLRELAEGGRLPVSVASFIIAEVLRGLAFAHELTHQGRPMGMVHRDVSPHNVLISWNGAVKLSDFGIAKAMGATGASRTGSLKGKVGYMSPEQAHAVAIDGRSDVFAVGVMFHELLTGERLFAGATEAEVLSRMLAQPIEPPRKSNPEVSDDLDAVCMGMLERDRERRFASARAALEALLNCDVVSARGELELGKLIRTRFPQVAPARLNETGVAPLVGGDATAPLRAASTDVAAAMEAPTRTAGVGEKTATPTAAGQRGPLLTETDIGPPKRSFAWLPGVLTAAAIGAAVVATIMVTQGSDSSTPSASVPPPGIDAAAIAQAPTLDAAVAVAAIPDAAPPVVVEPDSAPRVETRAERKKREREERRRREKKKREREAELAKLKERPLPVETPPPPPPDKKPPEREEPAGEGELVVSVKPWATVTVKGHGTQDTPARFKLPAGKHKVTLVNDDLDVRVTVTVRIRDGKPTTLSRDFRK